MQRVADDGCLVRMPAAFGIGGLIGSPIAGFLFDKTGSYLLPTILSGSCFVVTGLSILYAATAPRFVQSKGHRALLAISQPQSPAAAADASDGEKANMTAGRSSGDNPDEDHSRKGGGDQQFEGVEEGDPDDVKHSISPPGLVEAEDAIGSP